MVLIFVCVLIADCVAMYSVRFAALCETWVAVLIAATITFGFISFICLCLAFINLRLAQRTLPYRHFR